MSLVDVKERLEADKAEFADVDGDHSIRDREYLLGLLEDATRPDMVTTQEELRELGPESVISCAYDIIHELCGDGEGGHVWRTTGDPDAYNHEDVDLPAVVLRRTAPLHPNAEAIR